MPASHRFILLLAAFVALVALVLPLTPLLIDIGAIIAIVVAVLARTPIMRRLAWALICGLLIASIRSLLVIAAHGLDDVFELLNSLVPLVLTGIAFVAMLVRRRRDDLPSAAA